MLSALLLVMLVIFLLDRLATLRRSLFGFSREKERHRLKFMHVIYYVERLAAAIASSAESTTSSNGGTRFILAQIFNDELPLRVSGLLVPTHTSRRRSPREYKIQKEKEIKIRK